MDRIVILVLVAMFFGFTRNPAFAQRAGLTDRVRIGAELSPDLVIGTVMADTARQIRVADFRGKLLILDFWHTGCAPCIRAFPKMESLQTLFGDRIQILLVNPMETYGEILGRIKNAQGTAGMGLAKLVENTRLPIVLASAELRRLIPPQGFPSHAWIDGDGILRLFGSELNTHPDKIHELLSGHEIRFIHTSFTGAAYNFSEPLLLGPEVPGNRTIAVSAYSGFNFQLGGYASMKHTKANGLIRSTYINMEVLELYRHALAHWMENSAWKECMLSPYAVSNMPHLDLIDLQVEDTARYTTRFVGSERLTDEYIVGSAYCYELLTDTAIGRWDRSNLMLTDLNGIFAPLLGIRISVTEQHRDGYELIRVPGDTQRNAKPTGHTTVCSVREMLEMFCRERPISGRPLVFCGDSALASTTFRFPVPDGNGTLEDLNGVLAAYGMGLVKTSRKLPILQLAER